MAEEHWTQHLLVTGGAGFIGSVLVRRLLDAGQQVTVLDDLSSGSRHSLSDHPNLRFVEGDVLDAAAVHDAAEGCTGLLHLAGVVGMRLATQQADYAYRVATEGTGRILEETGSMPAVLFSSSAVYGHAADSAISETAPLPREAVEEYDGGRLGYALGKWEMERLGREAAASGRRVLAIRPFNVVGRGQSHAHGMVLPNFARNALMNEPLEIHDEGKQSRTFCEVGTFAETVLRVLTHPEAFGEGFRALNVGSAEPAGILELAELVLLRAGSGSPLRFVPYDTVFPGRTDVQSRVPNISTLESLIGTVVWPDLAAIVDDALADQRERLATTTSET